MAGQALPGRLRGSQRAVSGCDLHHHPRRQLLGHEEPRVLSQLERLRQVQSVYAT